jgi:uncharacterized protein (TIGR03435 family)
MESSGCDSDYFQIMTRAAAVPILAAFVSAACFGQAPATPEFEVASIRASNPEIGLIQNRTPNLNTDPGRNLNFANISLRDLIMLAYGVGARQISGPEFLTNRFNIVARVPADAAKEQIPLMLQTLLAQRFKLALHRDHKVMQIYALEVAKNGPKMHETAEDDKGESGCSRSFAETQGATLAAVCHKMYSANVAQQLQALAPGYFTDGPILDESGLKGVYDFKLQWITQVEAKNGSDGPTIFDAVQQQLGLKLDARKESVELLIIDHCEKEPTEN